MFSSPTSFSARMMRKTVAQAVLWMGLFALLALAPVVIMFVQAPPSRARWLEFGVGLGVVGFAMLALQFATNPRFRWIAPFFGSDAVLRVHRWAGVLAFVLVMAHPLILLVVEPRFLEFLDPRVNAPRAVFLVAAVIGLLVLAILPFVRETIGLRYEWWQFTHSGAAAGVMLVGLAHGLQVGHYLSSLWKQALWVLITASALGLLLHLRVIRLWKQRRRPYRVTEVRKERGETWTLVLAPDGHEGIQFRGGQFTWLTLGDSPFSLQAHPFSFSSSANDDGSCDLTISALGDFTKAVKDVSPGTRAFLDGPYGSFTLDPEPGRGAVFIMGGIGITPAMSMLRACRDAGDRRPLLLIYANPSVEEITFKEELEELEGQLDLRVVHVLTDPPAEWVGETGFVTGDILERHLPQDRGDHQYFVCGPPPMMDLVEKEFGKLRVPVWNRSVERFDFA